jgi:hypothetical protein
VTVEKTAITTFFGNNFTPFYSKYFELKQAGKEFRAVCPFHDDHSPSLNINPTTGFYWCPVCGAKGDIFTFYAKHNGISGNFPAVLAGIAADFGISADVVATRAERKPGKIVATYDYTGPDGTLLFQVCRFDPKDFRQRRPDGKGGWIWDMQGVERVLYRLPELAGADEVFVCEGEKDADALAALGCTATCNAGGAGKWKPEYSESLAGKRCIIIPDADEPGRKHAELVAASLAGKAAWVGIIELPAAVNGRPVKDSTDFIEATGDPAAAAEKLGELYEGVAEWATEAGQESSPEADVATDENPWSRAVIDFDTLRKIKLPERRTFLYPWLTEQSMTLAYSWRGTGKSFFVLGIIGAVTKGESFGPWEAVEPVPCLYLDAEMPAGMLQERAEEMGIGGPETKAPARLISMNYALDLGLPRKNLLDAEWRGQLSQILIAGGYKLFFVDNIASLTPEIEENAKQAWDVINQWALELRFRGVSTVLLHHAGKSGTQRGTSGREDNVDTSILLKRPADYEVTDGCRFVCSFEKDRCTEGRNLLAEYEFQYHAGVWTFANSKTKNRDQVLNLLDKGKSQKEVGEELQLSKGRVSQIRREAITGGRLTEENKLTQSGFCDLFGAKTA